MKVLHECIRTIDRRAVVPWGVGARRSEVDIEKVNFRKRDENFLKDSLDGCGTHEKTAG